MFDLTKLPKYSDYQHMTDEQLWKEYDALVIVGNTIPRAESDYRYKIIEAVQTYHSYVRKVNQASEDLQTLLRKGLI